MSRESHLPSNTIVITGLGMVSSLGADVISSCAAARAGLTRWQELDVQVTDEETLEMLPLKGHEASWLTMGFEGFARWFRLGDAALRDLLEYAGVDQRALTRTGIHLQLLGDLLEEVHMRAEILDQLPEPMRDSIRRGILAERDESRQQLTRRLIPELLALNHLSFAPHAQAYAFGGAASFPRVLAWAIARLRSRALERCIVGGIDSWVESAALTRAYEAGLLRTPNRPVGRFPGEAAAFVLLERLDTARARGARIEGLLGSFATASERGHRFSGHRATGTALCEAITACLSEESQAPQELGLSIVNLNGDEQWAWEFGSALVRMKSTGVPCPPRQWCPAEHFGEIGAATGAAAICMGVRGFARGYTRSPAIMVALLDDEETRGAFLLREFPSAARPRRQC